MTLPSVECSETVEIIGLISVCFCPRAEGGRGGGDWLGLEPVGGAVSGGPVLHMDLVRWTQKSHRSKVAIPDHGYNDKEEV